MKTTLLRPAAVLLFVAFLGCGGGGGAVGEACDAEGNAGECDDGAICGKNAEALQCLKVCTEQADCTAEQECNGVSGSDVKGCRPKDTKK